MKKPGLTIALALRGSNLTSAQNSFPSSGTVGIGTTSPGDNLTINGTGRVGSSINTDDGSSSKAVLSFQRGSEHAAQKDRRAAHDQPAKQIEELKKVIEKK